MAQVNFWMGKAVHRKAKVLAVMRGETLNDFITEAIRAAVERDKGVVNSLLG